MSNNRIAFDGLEELKEALRVLPHRITEEAANIVEHTAQLAADELRAAYPEGPTGNLRRLVSVSRSRGIFATGAVVRNRAPHAAMFEYGTQARHTRSGIKRGRMPPGRVFIPVMTRRRKEMYAALRSTLQRNGLLVTGDAG